MERVKILSSYAVKSRLKRMAYQILESNFDEKELYIVSIGKKGNILAIELLKFLELIADFELHHINAFKDRNNKITNSVKLNADLPPNKHVIVLDDVLYSGKTTFLCIQEVFKAQSKQIQLLVLIDRGHRKFPVSPDFVGMTLATSLQQMVLLDIDENENRVQVFLE